MTNTIDLKITCNGTFAEVITALKDLVESYEASGYAYDSEGCMGFCRSNRK